eukprot:jgi/Ulvmu1/90/UM001_0093.1
MTHCHPGFHPFFGDAMTFDPMFRFGPGGRCRKFKGQHGHGCQNFARNIPLDMTETDEQLVILADVPGVSKEAINIEVDKNVLTINVASPTEPAPTGPTAETTPPADPAGDTAPLAQGSPDATPAEDTPKNADATPEKQASEPRVILQQRPKRFAKRSVMLPEGADLARAEAKCTDGVLSITIPKEELPETKKRVPIV